jgi:hypothetical protein
MSNPHIASSTLNDEPYVPFQLFAGDREVVTRPVTISSGANVAQYAVLGQITASGEYVLCNLAATDGSQIPRAIAAQPAAAAAADVVCPVYVAGFFNKAALVWHASFDLEREKDDAFLAGNHAISIGTVGYSSP